MEQAGHRSRKRGRRAASPDIGDSSSKKRGRPRVERGDESTAEVILSQVKRIGSCCTPCAHQELRRRTQIRMAQRAYRQRKESTLEELRAQVSDLTNTIGLMHHAFGECHSKLSATPGVAEAALQNIQRTSREFDALTKAVRVTEEHSSSEEAPAPRPERYSMPPQRDTEIHNVNSWLDETTLRPRPKSKTPMEVGLGYTMYIPNNVAPSRDYLGPNHYARGAVSEQSQPLDFIDDAIRAPLVTELSLPRSYSFHESSFARRLHRACTEAGYRLLLDPRRRPQALKVFALCPIVNNTPVLADCLRFTLGLGLRDPLCPLHDLGTSAGGAGTHYKHRDRFNHPTGQGPAGLEGPQTLLSLAQASRNIPKAEVAGYEGEWLDPYDVEGYLVERGVRIGPSSLYAEAEVVEWPETSYDVAMASSSQNFSALMNDAFGLDETATFGVEEHVDLDAYNTDLLSGSAWADNDILPSIAASSHNEGVQSAPANQQAPRSKSVVIDVTKLIDMLAVATVWLGRCPGYRRRDVDEALATATFSASF
ncbi:hypothetical protein LTR08_001595 [Meristemomyces frigidus]|nr:hypothetical protein LTR08_001595 [Meristemomyces frigidus]